MSDSLATVAAEMVRWETEDLASEQICVRCRDHVHTPTDLDPSPLCNLCAQAVAGFVPALLDELRAARTKLATLRASVIAAMSGAGPEVSEDERAG